jgi:DNA-binding NarL/FixJ family response regulator
LVAGRELLPAALVLTGEAGCGKTTLVEVAVREALSSGYQVLRCQPAQAEHGFPFAGLRDLLEGEDVGGVRLPAAQRMVLETALLLGRSPGPDATPGAVAVATHSMVRHLADKHPLVVVIDDVQWLDVSTEAVLCFVCRRLAGLAVAIVVAVRDRSRGQLLQTITRTFPEERVRVLPIGPLSLGATSVMLRQRFSSLSRPLLRRIHDASGGNPFYAIEIARSLDVLGHRPRPGEPLPFSSELTDLLDARVSRLPRQLRRHLPAVAASSRPTVTLLAALLPSGRVDRDVRLGVREGILVLEQERVKFAHPVLAEHCYSALTDDQRRTLHRRLAAVSADPVERARHLGLSASGPDPVIADALAVAAHQAGSTGAVASAAELAEQATALTAENQSELRYRRAIESARYHFMSGDAVRASTILQGLESTRVPGHLQGEALATHARVRLFTDDLPLAANLFQRAAESPGASAMVRCEAEEGLAWTLVLSRRQIAAAARHARTAVALARGSGKEAAFAESLATAAVCDAMMGRPDALAGVERAVALGSSFHFSRAVRRPEWAHALILIWQDRLADAVSVLRGLNDYAVDRGDDSSLARIHFALSCVHLLSGSWRESVVSADYATEVARETGQRAQVGMLLFAKSSLDAHLGDEAAVTAAANAARTGPSQGGEVAAALIACAAAGLTQLSLGEANAAHRQLAPAVGTVRRAGIVEPGAMRFVFDDIEALTHLGRVQEADSLLDWMNGCARATGRASALAAGARCRGLLLSAAGDAAGAVAALEQAAGQCPDVLPFDRARTLLALGIAQRRIRQKRAARTSLEEAGRVFAMLGASIWERQTNSELGRISGRTATSGLTPTELRIAELVAAGMSNREVAATLFVSVKTVETTLSHTYAKLGVHSRTALAHRISKIGETTGSGKLGRA